MTTTHRTPLNKINTLTVEVEQTFRNNYSIIAYDELGGVWQERFADTYEQAIQKANKLHDKIKKEYQSAQDGQLN